MNGDPRNLPARRLPVAGVFAEAIALWAGNSGRLFVWTSPIVALGLAAVGARALLPLSAAAHVGVSAAYLVFLVVSASAFSVRVHRMILLPGEPLPPFLSYILARGTWRYAGGVLVVAAMAVVPAVAGGGVSSLVSEVGLPEPLGDILGTALPYFLVQAVVAKRQLLFLTDISLHPGGSWRTSTAMGRGYGVRLAALNMLSGVYTLGVTLFTGWLVGTVFTEGPQDLLEFLTIVMGLPAQLGCFACLQAACYGRLSPDTAPLAG